MEWWTVIAGLQNEYFLPTVKLVKYLQMVLEYLAASGVVEMAFIEKIVNKRGFMNIPKQVFKHCTVKLGISPVYKYRQDNNIKYIGDINMF